MKRITIFLFLGVLIAACSVNKETGMSKKDLKNFDNKVKNMKNRSEAMEAYLKEKKITNFELDETGIYYVVDKQGDGAKPTHGQYAKVHYTGKLLDGTVFDSSKDRDEPFVFPLGQGRVIQGWDLGIPLFNVGGSGTLYLPSKLAYGSRGAGELIKPNSDLIFDIEVLDVMNNQEYATFMEKQREEQMKKMQEMMDKQVGVDKKIIEDYAKANGLAIQTSPSGLSYVIENPGDGRQPRSGNTVSVHYKGYLTDGTVFDSSYERGKPIDFPIGMGRVIKGWDEGIMLLRTGGKGKLLIPSPLGYGPRGAGGTIPPNAVLIFDVELMDVK